MKKQCGGIASHKEKRDCYHYNDDKTILLAHGCFYELCAGRVDVTKGAELLERRLKRHTGQAAAPQLVSQHDFGKAEQARYGTKRTVVKIMRCRRICIGVRSSHLAPARIDRTVMESPRAQSWPTAPILLRITAV